ncbi:MAG TPA: universal stress protein [Planctomycetota bacterium]|nr:universal stress protein [Planctomycetota bacterium]
MEHLKSVLCAVDLSACSKCALEQAARIAKRDGAALTLLHVIEPRVVEDLEEMMPDGSDVRKGVLDGARRELEKFSAGVVPPKTRLDVVAGEPLDTILLKAKEAAAELIVIGAFGVTGAGRGAGSLALKMARKSPIAVLLVDGRHAADFRSAMVGIDFSEESGRALFAALHLARLEGCPLHAVHVFAPPPLHYQAPTPQASPTYQRQFQAALKQRLEALVAEQRKQVGDVKVTCELFEHTSHGQGLIDYATKHEIDVVVVGTLGRSNLKTLLLGSTAERVVRETPCSVLAVPPKA